MTALNLIQQTQNMLANAKEELEASQLSQIYWQGQVDKFSSALESLVSIFPDAETAPVPVKGKKARKEVKPERHHTIPKTDKAFWLGLITAQPQKTGDILKAAAASLKIDENAHEEIKLLKQRQDSFLKTAVADNLIVSEGERMDRTYKLPA